MCLRRWCVQPAWSRGEINGRIVQAIQLGHDRLEHVINSAIDVVHFDLKIGVGLIEPRHERLEHLFHSVHLARSLSMKTPEPKTTVEQMAHKHITM